MRRLLLAAVFVIFFENVISGEMIDKWFRSNCYRFIPFPLPACKRNCPQLFSDGRCERYNGKWQCTCRSMEDDTKVYPLEEADCIQRASNGEQNLQCATDICPYGFQRGGEIVEEQGEWKWYCKAREFGNQRESRYTLDEARRVHSSCNSEYSDGVNGCRLLCPDNYKTGDCFLDRHPLVLRCACTIGHRLNDFYGVREAESIVRVCNSTFRDHGGCLNLCPTGFLFGRCSGTGNSRYCGCRQQDNGVGLYTIPVARRMMKVCNRNRQDHEECRGLCPRGFISEGRCISVQGHFECYCRKGNDDLIPLRQAIRDFEESNRSDLRRARARTLETTV